MLMYEKVYKILKSKIQSGLIPYGARLPSRAELCREYSISEKTVRRALELLSADGYIETSQRRRPIVCYNDSQGDDPGLAQRRVYVVDTDEILKTTILLCFPFLKNGLSLCTEKDWAIPETIAANRCV